MDTKKRRLSSSSSKIPFELAIFALDQVTEFGIILLEEYAGSLLPLFVNSAFCQLFGVSKDFGARLHLEELIAQKDISLFHSYINESSNQWHRIRILKRRALEDKTQEVQKDAKVTCSRFNENFICCKFQLNDPSLEQKLKYHQIVEEKLEIPWAFFRLDAQNKDLCALYVNQHNRMLRKDFANETSYYCRSDGALGDEQLDWWIERLSKLSEDNPKDVVKKEVIVFGEPHSYQITHWFLYRDETGCPVFLNTRQDVSEAKQLQTMISDQEKHLSELDSSNRYLRHFFDLAPLFMGVVKLTDNNTNLECILVNQAHESRAGFTMAGRRISEFASPERVQLWVERFLKIKGSKEVFQARDIFDDEKNPGTKLFWDTYLVHMEGDVFAYMMHDMTNNQRLQDELTKHRSDLEENIQERTKQLEAALHVKSRFLATMSHEMRTPLSGSMGAMSLLEETPLSAEQRNFVRIAQVCGQQLLSVINDVLDLSKLEENKLVLEKEPFDIRNALEECLDMVSFEATKKGLELICAIETTVPETVVGDAGRLRQIIVNLLSNAVKFSSKGEVVLRAKAERLNEANDAEITISVQDDGIGIQEEDRHKLFQVFTQLDNSVTRKHGGTGLGLSICQRMAELMQGKIWFESTPGRGSIFYTRIVAPTLASPSSSNYFLWNFPPLKCAIVDYSDTFANHLKILLERLGNQAAVYSKLECVGEFDCLFVDCRYSIKSIRSASKSKHVILTSYTAQQFKVPQDFYLLEKPLREFKLHQLISDIRNNNTKSLAKSFPAAESSPGCFSREVSILLAEDNEMNQQIITRMLSNLSFSKIKVVSNGRLAVEQVREKEYDLVLMDVMMPEMGGIEATEIIRKEMGERPVIVALTANAFAEDRERCLEAGMQEVLTKPVQKSQLMNIFKVFFPG